MITKITLSKIASYDQPTSLTTDKRINLIFGLNGTGKSILSEYLRCKDNGDDEYSSCELKGHDGEKILVYNQGFVEENFYALEDQKQKGIFTVAKENADAIQQIKSAEDALKGLQDCLKKKKVLLETKELEKKRKSKELTEKVWPIVRKNKSNSLKFCVAGFGSDKEKLLNHLLNQQIPTAEPASSIERLAKESSQIEDNKSLGEISKIDATKFLDIEQKSIWAEAISGDQNNLLANMIKERDNENWVQKGRAYIPENIELPAPCPFCQKETIDQNLLGQFEKYFNPTFESKLKEIKELGSNYSDLFSEIKNNQAYLDNIYVKENIEEFRELSEKMHKLIKKNIHSISRKKDFLNESISLKESISCIHDFNAFVDKINEKIAEHNQRIAESEQTEKNIKSTFWEHMLWDYKIDLDQWHTYYASYTKDIGNINSSILSLEKAIRKNHEIISQQNKNITGVEASIENINQRLKGIGIDDFYIEPYVDGANDQYYKISRTGSKKEVFPSLSEGEKMLISFLYFLELCSGKESADEGNIKKIVVIDDPISSLSHNHVFNISYLISQHLIPQQNKSDILQLFVLTHSLYFLNELSRRISKPKKSTTYLRIEKSNHGSIINPMDENDIASDYQHYWHIIKQCSPEGPQYLKVVMANVMRNIFEYYFNFIQNSTYQDSIRDLASKERKYQSFMRYMDKESHSYPFDYSSIDYQVYLDAFEQVFIDTGQHDHYKKYMHPEKNMAGTE